MDTGVSHHERVWPHAIGGIGAIALIIWFANWAGPDQPGAAAEAVWVFLSSGPAVIAWLAAAMGYGWLLRLAAARSAQDGMTLQIGLGIAALLWLDAACGAAGFLQVGGSTGAWLIIAIGAAAFVGQIARLIHQRTAIHPPHWLMWTAAPACAVLLVAACSAPGVLWATEFGGYDALSYHLQLPKEWLALGRIQPLEHNVYSFLPSYMEAAYYHLAVLHGDAIAAAYSCQLLHAAVTILAAVALARFVGRTINHIVGLAAATLLLGTPWVIVAGSLAYSEMAVVLMFIVGLSAMHEEGLSPAQRGWIAGVVAAAACGAKLTAAGLVVAPLLLSVAIAQPPRAWLRIAAPMAIGAVFVMLPYFVRNFAHVGNPVFPFATGIFGTAHWTTEQAAIWRDAHISGASMTARLHEAWNQFLRFGIGENPSGGAEPWKPQWSILPWLGIAAMLVAVANRNRRRSAIAIIAMFAAQFAFWFLLTHLKSRFLVPVAVPLILATSEALGILAQRARSQMWLAIGTVALLAWSLQPAFIFHGEASGAPAIAIGAVDVMTGDALNDQQRDEFGRQTLPAVALNHLLPGDARILSIGFATPFYVRADLEYHTTWDRGTLSQLMREFPDDQAAWARELHQRGFTHLIVDRTMLRIWNKAGWNDPLLTPQRIDAFIAQCAQPLFEYPSGLTIYELRLRESTP